MKISDYEPCYKNSEWIELSTEEIDTARDYGIQKWKRSQELGLKNAHGWKGTPAKGMRIQALGEVAEAAAAKAVGLKWKPRSETFKDADIIGGIEVKMLGGERYGLRIYHDTPDQRKVIGVIIVPGGERKPYRIPGWFIAGEAKMEDWLITPDNGRPPFFAVPQSVLRPISEIRAMIKPGQLEFA